LETLLTYDRSSTRELAKLPQESVEVDSFSVCFNALSVEESLLPPGVVVPLCAPCGHGKIGPSVGNPHVAEVADAGRLSVLGDESVRRARVAMTHNKFVNRGWLRGSQPRVFDRNALEVGTPGRNIKKSVG